MVHYKVTKFNKRRLERGEKYCLRADVFINQDYDGWTWLRIEDISRIEKDRKWAIEVDSEVKQEINKKINWDKIWNSEDSK